MRVRGTGTRDTRRNRESTGREAFVVLPDEIHDDSADDVRRDHQIAHLQVVKHTNTHRISVRGES
jgi:hypothetical protein